MGRAVPAVPALVSAGQHLWGALWTSLCNKREAIHLLRTSTFALPHSHFHIPTSHFKLPSQQTQATPGATQP